MHVDLLPDYIQCHREKREAILTTMLDLYNNTEEGWHRIAMAIAIWTIQDFAVDDRVYYTVSGMDCDCSTFYWLRDCKAIPSEVVNSVENEYSWADGPIEVTFVAPSDLSRVREEVKAFSSRDYILEAYENGNPTSIIL